MKHYTDFNALMNEAERIAPKGFQIKNEQFNLPVELPAKILFQVSKLDAINVKEMPAAKVMIEYGNVFISIFSAIDGNTKENGIAEFERLLDTGISMAGLDSILTWIFNQYNQSESISPKVTRGKVKK